MNEEEEQEKYKSKLCFPLIEIPEIDDEIFALNTIFRNELFKKSYRNQFDV